MVIERSKIVLDKVHVFLVDAEYIDLKCQSHFKQDLSTVDILPKKGKGKSFLVKPQNIDQSPINDVTTSMKDIKIEDNDVTITEHDSPETSTEKLSKIPQFASNEEAKNNSQ